MWTDALARSMYIPGINGISPHLLFAGCRACHRSRSGNIWRTMYSTCLTAPAFLEAVGWWTGCSSSADSISFNHSGVLSHGRSGSMDRKGSSYHDMLLLHERLYLEECCVPCRSCCSMGVYHVPAPFQSWDQNPRGTLSFLFSVP